MHVADERRLTSKMCDICDVRMKNALLFLCLVRRRHPIAMKQKFFFEMRQPSSCSSLGWCTLSCAMRNGNDAMIALWVAMQSQRSNTFFALYQSFQCISFSSYFFDLHNTQYTGARLQWQVKDTHELNGKNETIETKTKGKFASLRFETIFCASFFFVSRHTISFSVYSLTFSFDFVHSSVAATFSFFQLFLRISRWIKRGRWLNRGEMILW